MFSVWLIEQETNAADRTNVIAHFAKWLRLLDRFEDLNPPYGSVVDHTSLQDGRDDHLGPSTATTSDRHYLKLSG
jgi:hypothetical protein